MKIKGKFQASPAGAAVLHTFLCAILGWEVCYMLWIFHFVMSKVYRGLFKLLKKFIMNILPSAHGMWDFSSQTRDQTCTPCIGKNKSLNHWTARERPYCGLY